MRMSRKARRDIHGIDAVSVASEQVSQVQSQKKKPQASPQTSRQTWGKDEKAGVPSPAHEQSGCLGKAWLLALMQHPGLSSTHLDRLVWQRGFPGAVSWIISHRRGAHPQHHRTCADPCSDMGDVVCISAWSRGHSSDMSGNISLLRRTVALETRPA